MWVYARDEVRALHVAARDEDSRCKEVEAAIPIALQRLRRAEEQERRTKSATAARLANEKRRVRLEAAARVDAAWKALGQAFADHQATDPGGTPEATTILLRRSKYAHRGAAYQWAASLCRVLDVPSVASEATGLSGTQADTKVRMQSATKQPHFHFISLSFKPLTSWADGSG